MLAVLRRKQVSKRAGLSESQIDNAVSCRRIYIENDGGCGFNSCLTVFPATSVTTHLSKPIIQNLITILTRPPKIEAPKSCVDRLGHACHHNS